MTDTPVIPVPTASSRAITLLDAQFIICMALLLSVAGLALFLVFHEVPTSNQGMLDGVLGSLVTMLVTATGWFFMSSQSSKAKDNTIAAIATAPEPPPPNPPPP